MKPLKEAIKNKFAFFLTISGILVIPVSLLFDIFASGKKGVGIAQLSVAIVGAACAILGIGLVLSRSENGSVTTPSLWFAKFPKPSNFFWVGIGFAVAYILFLIIPMFFSPIPRIVYFNRYLPDQSPIGGDLIRTLASINAWFTTGKAPFYYPPLLTILFSPLLLLSYPVTYYIITILTIISFAILAIIISHLITEKENRALAVFVFGVSFFSYGLQFELERGQFHTITIMLCIAAVYLFHRHPRYRFFAYVLFCISVQFKLYPAIFFVMFVDDWREWKTNSRRFLALGLVNFSLLFLLGYSYFQKLISHLAESGLALQEVWNGNHSIAGFLYYLLEPESKFLAERSVIWLSSNIFWVSNLFLVYFVICFLIVWLSSYRHNTHRVDSFLLMACVLGGLLIPSINHDYTLPLLTAPFALMVSEQYSSSAAKNIVSGLLLTIASFAYAVTLVPFIHKPPFLLNSFPLLMILLTTTTLLSLLRDKDNVTFPVTEKLDA